jgi:hypothetical protein
MTTTKIAMPRERHFSYNDPKAPGSPWGSTQSLYDHPTLRGVRIVSTASHGGMGIAGGIARKVLSPAAYKIGEKYGGYVWFEEDVGISIPYYEHPEWYPLLVGKPLTDAVKMDLERSIRQSYPRYFKMREEGYKLPEALRVGDTLRVILPIHLSRGPGLAVGDLLLVTKLTATYFYASSPTRTSLRIKLPVGYYLGATGWGTTEDKIYVEKVPSPARVAALKLSGRKEKPPETHAVRMEKILKDFDKSVAKRWPGVKHEKASFGKIEDDTPIMPWVVAQSVIEEAQKETGASLNVRNLVRSLSTRAQTTYEHNEDFRKKVRGRGDSGRDTLYAFMRHWLAAYLKKEQPDVFRKLPGDWFSR